MKRFLRAWLVLPWLVLAAHQAVAEDVLVPEGESADILQGVSWSAQAELHAVAASPDGRLLASVARDGTLRVWDAVTGRELRRFPADPEAQQAVAFSGDGHFIATGDHNGVVQLWDLSGTERGRTAGSGPIVAVALNQNGGRVFFGVAHEGVSAWQPAESSPPTRLSGTRDVRVIEASPDGRVVAVGLSVGEVEIFDADSLHLIRAIRGVSGHVSAEGFSSDGKTLAIGTDSGTIELASMEDGQILRKIQARTGRVTGVRFAADGVLVATGEGAVGWFNAATGDELRHVATESHCCTGLAAVDGGKTVVFVSPRALLRRDVVSGAALPDLVGPASPVVAVATDADGASILVGTLDGSLRLFDVETGAVRRSWSLTQPPSAIALSSDGHTVYVADDSAIVAWDAGGEQLRRFEGHERAVLSLAVTADGAFLVSGSADHSVRVWDTKTGKEVDRLALRSQATTVAVSPDGAFVAAVSGAGARLFTRGPEPKSVRLDVQGTPSSLAFSQDGKRLAVGLSDGLRLFDVAKGTAIGKVIGHGEVTGVALTHDGKEALATSAEAGLQVWKDGGTAAGTLAQVARGGSCVAISASTGIGVVGTDDGAVHLWKPGEADERLWLRQSNAGWVSSQHGKVVRNDSGQWVVRAGANGELASVSPSGAAKAELSIELGATEPVSEAGVGHVTVKVTNKSTATRAYWLQLAAADGVPEGLTILPSDVVDRLEPGASANLTASVAWSSHGGAPAPKDVRVPLRVLELGGDTAVPSVSLHARSAKIELSVTDVGASIAAEVTNRGDEASGPIQLRPSIVANDKPVFVAPSTELPDLAPGQTARIGVAAGKEVQLDGAQLQVDVVAKGWPTEHWTVKAPLVQTLPWREIGIGVAALLLLLIIAWRMSRTARDPIVLNVSRDATELTKYGLEQLSDVDRVLRRARHLGSALTAAKVSPASWNRAVAASGSPEATAAAVAECVGAKRGEALSAGVPAWSLDLPALDVRFPRKTALVACSGKRLESAAGATLAAAVHANGNGPNIAIALDLTTQQNAGAVLRNAPRVAFIVLTVEQVRDVLLSSQPLIALQKIISLQRPLGELSPYQTSGGVDEEGLFFGRERELRAIADRALHNFIIVAPRQMGKSSLLKAAQRKLAARPDVEAHLITLLDDDLMTRIGKALNRPRPENAEQFMEAAAGTPERPKAWLIDEADAFVSKDARQRYPIAQAMRALAEEGKAYFILAGFWHLYAAVYLNPNSPLRNFGEKLRLEPLDRESARALATRPMESLSVKFHSTSAVDRLLDETACRAHLIARVCQGLIERLGATDRVITEAHLDAALYRNPTVADEFKYWRREPLGRALLRGALIEQPPTRAELRERLAGFGLDVSSELYEGSLDRLELGYLLVTNEQGKLVCPVPLLRRMIVEEGALEEGVRRDLRELAELQHAEQRPAATG